MRPFEAALKGAGQIGFTIISITFSLIAVFIPLLFMGGIIGRLFREFAVTVSVAVVASALISLTLTPVLCSLFLKEQALHQAGRFNRALESGFNWMLRVYDRGLGFVFRHQLPTLLSTLALIVLTGYLYVTIPKGFFPEQDTGFIFGQADAREDISFSGDGRRSRIRSSILSARIPTSPAFSPSPAPPPTTRPRIPLGCSSS